MHALDAWRVSADPSVLDRIRWVPIDSREVTLIRLAPDEVLAIDVVAPIVDDQHAIVELETGFVGSWDWSLEDVRAHTEWALPVARPATAQGAIAGVPAKVSISADDRVLVVTAAAYDAVLTERLGDHR